MRPRAGLATVALATTVLALASTASARSINCGPFPVNGGRVSSMTVTRQTRNAAKGVVKALYRVEGTKTYPGAWPRVEVLQRNQAHFLLAWQAGPRCALSPQLVSHRRRPSHAAATPPPAAPGSGRHAGPA